MSHTNRTAPWWPSASRGRNTLLVAAGFAPMYRERKLDDAALARAREAIELVLEAQKPFPAFALDRHWNIAASNRALQELYEDVAEELLQPPVNAMRLSLHPKGVAPRIENLAEWRAHLLARLRKQVELTADPVPEISVLGTPVNVTLSELAIEMFFPAHEQTEEAVRRSAE